MAGEKDHLTGFADFFAPIYDLRFWSFWLGSKNDFRQRLIEAMDLTVHESVLSEAL